MKEEGELGMSSIHKVCCSLLYAESRVDFSPSESNIWHMDTKFFNQFGTSFYDGKTSNLLPAYWYILIDNQNIHALWKFGVEVMNVNLLD